MTRLSPIHHAMARAMPVSGGPPVRAGDRVHWSDEPAISIRATRSAWERGRWWAYFDSCGVTYSCIVQPPDNVIPAPRVPPSGGFGRKQPR